jgi:hypothetical protein
MPSNPPVDFQALAQGAAGTTNKDYPYAIKATDLMRNFVFATLDIEDGLVEETTGAQGHRQRKFKIPAPAGAEDALQLVYDANTFSWEPITEIPEGDKTGQIIFWKEEQWTLSEAPEKSGQFLVWNEILEAYDVIVAPTADGQFLVWDKDAKVWKYIPTPTADGQILNWDQTTKAWKHITAPTQQGQLLKWDDTLKNWVPLSGTTEGQLLQWSATNGWGPFTAPPTSGTHVLGAVDGALAWIATEECD